MLKQVVEFGKLSATKQLAKLKEMTGLVGHPDFKSAAKRKAMFKFLLEKSDE